MPENGAATAENYSHLPLAFEKNEGQTDGRVDFISRAAGYTLFLTPTEAIMSLAGAATPTAPHAGPEEHAIELGNHESETAPAAGAVLRMQIVGGNPEARPVAIERLPGIVNYFLGNDPAQWHTNIPTFGRVEYQDVYPGIDLVYYDNGGNLEYDFVVSPGADLNVIQLDFVGANGLTRNNQGDLLVETSHGIVVQNQPVVYQQSSAGTDHVAGEFQLSMGDSKVSFNVGSYDTTKPLVIDPVVVYSTYFGGQSTDRGSGVAINDQGQVYVAGETASIDFPLQDPFQKRLQFFDAFVAKFSANGKPIYSTYLGGRNFDKALGIAVDKDENAHLVGITTSRDFPIVNPWQSAFAGSVDTFVTKINAMGNRLAYSTYVGGKKNDEGEAIAVTHDGMAVITGLTGSEDFPTVNAWQHHFKGVNDAFVAKLTADGSTMVFATYLGGAKNDYGYGVAVDGSGNAFVTGGTFSRDFPVVNPLQAHSLDGEAFVAKLDAVMGIPVYSTFLGGSSWDYGVSIDVDSRGVAFITGATHSSDFPTKNPIQLRRHGFADVWVVSLSNMGSELIYATYLGGSKGDWGAGIAIDAAGSAYVTGFTDSANYPIRNAVQSKKGLGTDAFITNISSDGRHFVYSTFIGSSGYEEAIGIAANSIGTAVITGRLISNDFPTKRAFQPKYGGGDEDGFVTVIAQ